METYWIVKKDGIVVAALIERSYKDKPKEMIEDLRELGHSGPIEIIMSTGEIRIGESLEA